MWYVIQVYTGAEEEICRQCRRRIMEKDKIDQFVSRINAPIICRFEDQEWNFNDGKELAEYSFDKCLLIDSLTIEGGKVVLTLSELTQQSTNWTGEEPNLFDGV